MYFYLFAAVLGGALLLGSLLLGGHHHGGPAGDDGHDGPALLLLQGSIYLCAFGGLTGLLLRALAGVPEPVCAALALLSGAGAAALARLILRRAGASPSGTIRDADCVGLSATVLLPFGKGQTGKVRVLVQQQVLDLLATTDDPPTAAGDEVLIVDVRDGTALVSRAPLQAGQSAARAPIATTR